MTRQTHRRGFVLITAMVILFAIASLALTLGRSARLDSQASANSVAYYEAMAVERGAEQYVLSALTDNFDSLADAGEADWAGVPVGRGAFWIIRPDYLDNDLPQFGLVDESGKIDLNTADFATLQRFPDMTDEIAASIIDWRDEDDTPTESVGAESGEYLALRDPYRCKNAAFEGVEELSMIRGMTQQLMRGEVGTGQPGSQSSQLGSEGARHAGWAEFFTVYSKRTGNNNNVQRGRINVNTAPAAVLRCLPNLDDSDVNALLSARTAAVSNDPTSTTWFNDTLKEKANGLGNRITGQGRCYSADIVAAAGNGRAFRRVRIIVDTTLTPAQIVYRRDLTDRGWPLDRAILESLRSGNGIYGGSMTRGSGGGI